MTAVQLMILGALLGAIVALVFLILGLTAKRPKLVGVGAGSGTIRVPSRDVMASNVSIRNDPTLLGIRIPREAANLEDMQHEIELAKKRFGLPETARVLSCYEAGRHGFWLHRYLVDVGVENVVVDSSSIQVDRRFRRAKTDRMVVAKLLEQLIRYEQGERKV